MKMTQKHMSVAIIVPPGAQSLDISGPMDAFLEANRLSGGAVDYRLSLIAMTANRIIPAGGMSLMADTSIFEATQSIDTLLVAGTPDYTLAYDCAGLHAWLKDHVPLTRRHGSVGTGAFFLGAAGLLDGMSATTHWQHTAELARYCPKANILFDHIYVEDRTLYTSAGVTAGIDLALRLIEDDYGRELARKIANRLVVSLKNSKNQLKFSVNLTAPSGGSERVRDVQHWVLNHLALDLKLESLAARAGMGARHFARTFQRETGITPHDYVEEARVDAAQKLINESDMLLQNIAKRCGFVNQDVMRRAFLRRIGVQPGLYRKRLRAGVSSRINRNKLDNRARQQ